MRAFKFTVIVDEDEKNMIETLAAVHGCEPGVLVRGLIRAAFDDLSAELSSPINDYAWGELGGWNGLAS